MSFDYESLVFDLPEDINRAKIAGDYERFTEMLESRLNDSRTSPMMKKRLETEKLTFNRWLKRYIYTKDQAIEYANTRLKEFTYKDLEHYENIGMVEYIYYHGEKRYLNSFCSTLIKTCPEIAARRIQIPESVDDGTALKPYIANIKQTGESKYRYRISSSLKIEDESFEKGATYTVHLPIPAPSAQQSADEIKIFADSDALISKPDAYQRTLCYRRRLDENAPFNVTYEYVSHLKYVDPFRHAPRIVYPDSLEPNADDLSEQYPHIVFTPYLKQLAQYIKGDETRPLYIAKKIYDYITLNVRYSFMRSYMLIDRQAEYCALNMKGDCGIQALLFITLCRISGIPARWQSGLTVDRFSTGCHDWAQFYTDEFGWLFADPSYGGGGARNNDEEKREFYFGNLDPFRMIANRRFMSEYEVPKKFIRYDPCDTQEGEVETDQRALDGSEYDKTDKTEMFERLI